MNYYLIKPLNCIVSDAEIMIDDYALNPKYIGTSFEPITKCNNSNKLSIQEWWKKIEYSNNLEGLKPFELIDEEEREIRDALGMTYDAQINGQPKFKKMFQDDMIESLKTIREFNYKNGYPTKAKAGYTEEDLFNAIQYGIESSRESLSVQQRLDIFLNNLDSKPIEVIQIKDSVFKIKKS